MAFRFTVYTVTTNFYIKILFAYICVAIDNLCFVFRTFDFINVLLLLYIIFPPHFLLPHPYPSCHLSLYLQSPSSTLCPA